MTRHKTVTRRPVQARLRLFASCPRGLEELLRDELIALGAPDARAARGGVSFRGDRKLAYGCCLWSRLASRILWQLGRFEAADADQLYQQCSDYPWERHFSPEMTLAVDFIGRSDAIRNSIFGAQRVKDAIVDRLRAVTGVRPDVDPDNPTARIIARLQGGLLTVSLDLAGLPLHRRGYRPEGGPAPLKETLAAALLLRAGWPELASAGGGLYDPVCGSGTLLIEGAMMAADQAPGLLRDFAFTAWPDFDAALWQQLRSDAEQRRAAGATRLPPIAGSDQDERAVIQARECLNRAGLAGRITVNCEPLTSQQRPAASPAAGLLIANPPYGERLGKVATLDALYRDIGDFWRAQFPAWRIGLYSSHWELLRAAALPAGREFRLRNGALDCRLLVADPEGAVQRKSQADPPPAPATVPAAESTAVLSPGAAMLANRLRKNRKRLSRWLRQAGVDCYRLYDADMPEYAVSVDIYGDWVQVCEYAPPPTVDPVSAAGRFAEAMSAVSMGLGVAPDRIVAKRRERQRGRQQYQRLAQAGHFIAVHEHGARLWVNLQDYLDTGLFLDHRPMRRRLAELAGGKRLLNLFCYTATATVQAALAGAVASVSVDLSQVYLDWAARNLAENGIESEQHRLLRADCVEWLAQERNEYDLIFVDPPTFSNSKRMRNTLDLQRDHVDLLQAAARLLAPGGTILFSTNRRRFVLDQDALPDLDCEDITASSWDPDFSRTRIAHSCYLLRTR